MISPIQTQPIQSDGAASRPRESELREAAQMLEATFLAEMLKFAGMGEARDSFGGGAGEAQFAGMLASEQARIMAQAGGIGLAETLFRSLLEREEVQT